MREERCPWDSGSDEDEDDDWLYSSVSRYQHLLMCRLGVVGSCLAVSQSGRCLALAGKAGDREEMAVYKMPGKLMADNPVDEGLTSSRDFGLLAGTVQAGKVDQLQFLGEESVVVGQRGAKGASLWTWQGAEGDLVTCKERWSQTEVDCEVLEVGEKQVFISGGGKVARLSGDHWEERQVTSASVGLITNLLQDGEECLWVAHSSGGVQLIDWRSPPDSTPVKQISGQTAKHGQCTLLMRSHQGSCIIATLDPCGVLNLTSTDSSPLGELKLPITPSLTPVSPLLARGRAGRLVASLGGDIWVVDTAPLQIEFCHDGHSRRGRGNQVLGVAAHPRERLLLSSDSLGALHAWQYNPTK